VSPLSFLPDLGDRATGGATRAVGVVGGRGVTALTGDGAGGTAGHKRTHGLAAVVRENEMFP